MTESDHAYTTACLRVTGCILAGSCPPQYARLLPAPLPLILASGPGWRAKTIELDATEVVAAALVTARFTSEEETEEAIAFLQDDKARVVLLRHHERVSKAAAKSAAIAARELL